MFRPLGQAALGGCFSACPPGGGAVLLRSLGRSLGDNIYYDSAFRVWRILGACKMRQTLMRPPCPVPERSEWYGKPRKNLKLIKY